MRTYSVQVQLASTTFPLCVFHGLEYLMYGRMKDCGHAPSAEANDHAGSREFVICTILRDSALITHSKDG